MLLAVAYSARDPAGRGIGRELASLLDARKVDCPQAVECYAAGEYRIAGFDAEPIELEMIGETPDPSATAVIVLSRHRAESGKKSLTLHHPGNPTKSTLGGEPEVLALAHPPLAKTLFKSLKRAAGETGLGETHEVVLEATHHGPTSPSKPVVFIELGSTPEDWKNPQGWRTVALAVAMVLEDPKLEACTPVAAFGETHYPQKFTEIQLNSSELCIGHIIPRYAFRQGLSESVLRQALTRSEPRAEKALVRKKSLRSSEIGAVLKAAQELGIQVETI